MLTERWALSPEGQELTIALEKSGVDPDLAVEVVVVIMGEKAWKLPEASDEG